MNKTLNKNHRHVNLCAVLAKYGVLEAKIYGREMLHGSFTKESNLIPNRRKHG
jgi:hypothetical protein